MDRFERTVLSTMIKNMRSQLDAFETIIAASAQPEEYSTTQPHRPPKMGSDTEYTTDEEDKEIERAIAEQTQAESDTLGEVWAGAHNQMNNQPEAGFIDGNEGRGEG